MVVPAREWWDSIQNLFVSTNETQLIMEHSLISVSKWEAKHKRSYFSSKQMTMEELLDYYRCMTINTVDPMVYASMTRAMIKEIDDYIADPQTATTFNERGLKEGQSRGFRNRITSEVIYAMMIELGIPLECEKWHLNRLMTLIRVCQTRQNGNGKKMSKNDILRQNHALNQARRARSGSRG